MWLPRKNRLALYSHLFREGVIAVQNDVFRKSHGQVPIPNLEVMMMMKSLHSRNFVTKVFAWHWYYYTLTDTGVEYLRNFLHLAPETLPDTHKKLTPTAPPAAFGQVSRGDRGEGSFGARRGRGGAAREGYRAPKGEGGAPSDFNPEFRGSRGGRGRGGSRFGGSSRPLPAESAAPASE